MYLPRASSRRGRQPKCGLICSARHPGCRDAVRVSLVPRSRRGRRVLTRRLRSSGSCSPTSARRSIARLYSSRSRGGHWRRCSSSMDGDSRGYRATRARNSGSPRQPPPLSGPRCRPAAAARPYGCRTRAGLACRQRSRPETSRGRSAFRGRTPPSNWAARPGWSPFTRWRPSGPTIGSSPPRSPWASRRAG